MKHFTFRLFLIRKLIESLMWSSIDEYTEYEEIADGLARAHSAMEKLVSARKKGIADETYSVVRQLAKTEQCHGHSCKDCPFDNKTHPITKEQAIKWLAEHGIKE